METLVFVVISVLLATPFVALVALIKTFGNARKIRALVSLQENNESQLNDLRREVAALRRRLPREWLSEDVTPPPVPEWTLQPKTPQPSEPLSKAPTSDIPPELCLPVSGVTTTPSPLNELASVARVADPDTHQTVAEPPAANPLAEAPRIESPAIPIQVIMPDNYVEPAAQQLRQKRDWESLLGTQVFLKVGVLVVVLGMVLFLGYAFTRVGPLGKIAMGYSLAAVMLAGGLFAERRVRYRQFGRSLIAGGWGVAYFVTFATHYMPAARVIENSMLAVLAMVLMASAAAAHSLRYRHEWTTAFAFLLIFVSLALSAWEQQAVFNLVATVTAVVAANGLALRFRWSRHMMVNNLAGWLCALIWVELQMAQPADTMALTPLISMLAALWFSGQFSLLRWNGTLPDRWLTGTSVVHSCFALGMGLYVLQAYAPTWSYLWPLLLGVVGLMTCIPLRHRDDRSTYVIQATLALGALALVAPLKWGLSHEWTPALRLVGIEALWLGGLLLRDRYFRNLAYLALGVTFVEIAVRGLVDLDGAARVFLLSVCLTLAITNSVLCRRWACRYLPDREAKITASAFSWCSSVFLTLLIWLSGPDPYAAPLLVSASLLWSELAARRRESDLIWQSGSLVIAALVAMIVKAPVALDTISMALTAVGSYVIYVRSERDASDRGWLAQTGLIVGVLVLIGLVWRETDLPWTAAVFVGFGLLHQFWAWRTGRAHLLLASAALIGVGLWSHFLSPLDLVVETLATSKLLAGLFVSAGFYLGLVQSWNHRSQRSTLLEWSPYVYTVHGVLAVVVSSVLIWQQSAAIWLATAFAALATVSLWAARRWACTPLAYQGWFYAGLSILTYASFVWNGQGDGWLLPQRLEQGVLAFVFLLVAHWVTVCLTSLKEVDRPQLTNLTASALLVSATGLLLVLIKMVALGQHKNLLVALIWMLMGTCYLEVSKSSKRSDWFQVAHIILIAGAIHALLVNVIQTGGWPFMSYRALTVAIVLGFLIYAYTNWDGPAQQAQLSEKLRRVKPLYLYLAALILAVAMVYELHRAWVIVGWACMAVGGMAGCRFTGNDHGRTIALVTGFATVIRGFSTNFGYRDQLLDMQINWSAIPIAIALLIICYGLQHKIGMSRDASAWRLTRPYWLMTFTTLLIGFIWFETTGTSLTIWLSLQGVLAISLGFLAQDRVARWSGLGLLVFCILKLFIYDLRGLSGLPRIFSFIVLGMVLIGVSYAYTRFRERLEHLP